MQSIVLCQLSGGTCWLWETDAQYRCRPRYVSSVCEVNLVLTGASCVESFLATLNH